MPIFCMNCGAAIAEGKKFCTACGAKVDDIPQAQSAPFQPAQTQPAANAPTVSVMEQPYQAAPAPQPIPAPVYPVSQAAAPSYRPQTDDAPPKGSLYATISTLGYIGWMLLMSIPVAGWIITIVLALGKGPVNRRNLARAVLVFLAIGLVASLGTLLLMWPLLSEYIIFDFGI